MRQQLTDTKRWTPRHCLQSPLGGSAELPWGPGEEDGSEAGRRGLGPWPGRAPHGSEAQVENEGENGFLLRLIGVLR